MYEYSPLNSGDSQQNLVSFSVQAAYGTQVLTPPFGWKVSEDRYLFFVSWTSTEPPGLAPGRTVSGWSLVSDNLPVVRQASARGASPLPLELADLPTAVRTRAAELEEDNAVTTRVLAPGIPTLNVTMGQEGVRDAKDIFNDALQQYPEWLQDAAAAADMRRREGRPSDRGFGDASESTWATRVSQQLAQASSLLERDRAAARAFLRDVQRTVEKEKRDDPWLDSIRSALILVIEHVVEHLR